MPTIYKRLINQYKFNYQTAVSAKFDKQHEDNQPLDETELFNLSEIIQNLSESDIDNIDIRSPLEHQSQNQQMNDSG